MNPEELEQKEKKAGFAAITGRPNVGKSTLMNRLVGQKIAITSRKPQTTRNRIRTVYTDERGQVVFLDTPGIAKSKNRLGEYMATAAKGAFKDADVVLWIVDASSFIGPADRSIAKLLSELDTPVILVINKIDRIKKSERPGVIDEFKALAEVEETVPVSAKTGYNTDVLLEKIFGYLPFGPMYYDADTVTDMSVREIAGEIIREKALRCLGDEVPHGIAVQILKMSERPGSRITDIEADIICEKDSHKGMIIGKGGSKLKEIGTLSRQSIEELTDGRVNLKLWVKVRRDWRDSDIQVRNFGYNIKDL